MLSLSIVCVDNFVLRILEVSPPFTTCTFVCIYNFLNTSGSSFQIVSDERCMLFEGGSFWCDRYFGSGRVYQLGRCSRDSLLNL